LFSFYFPLLFFLKEEIENEKPAPEYRITFGEKPEGITSKEYELLYIEILYTIKHKIGTTISKHSGGDNDLYAYAQEAFGLTSNEHQRLLARASEEKVGHFNFSENKISTSSSSLAANIDFKY
jgi:hypothetical protein